MTCPSCHGEAVHAVSHDGEEICEIVCPVCQGLSVVQVGDHQAERRNPYLEEIITTKFEDYLPSPNPPFKGMGDE